MCKVNYISESIYVEDYSMLHDIRVIIVEDISSIRWQSLCNASISEDEMRLEGYTHIMDSSDLELDAKFFEYMIKGWKKYVRESVL